MIWMDLFYNRALSEDEIGQLYRASARMMKIK
jgi:hypothetical protein